MSPYARETVTVTRVWWNGEEWWIESENKHGDRFVNEASRWVEATVLVIPAPGDDDE